MCYYYATTSLHTSSSLRHLVAHQQVWHWWRVATQCCSAVQQHGLQEGQWVAGESTDVIACHQWTLLAAPSPSHRSAAHHPVRFHGCMLQCGVGLHCNNLCFAGADIKNLSDDIITHCQSTPCPLHCSVANQTSLCSAAAACCNMASVCKPSEQASRT